jgi:Zn-dependent protease with chaperone function
MHLIVICVVLIVIWQLRTREITWNSKWSDRWNRILLQFLLPPSLLLATSVAILLMGCHGKMLGINSGWWGCILALSFIIMSIGLLFQLAYQGYRSLQQVELYPQKSLLDTTARILDCDFPYSAQIGFWNSQLLISQGLLQTLDREHLEAVLAHEEAHAYYRDTFWFFWLGWLRRLTSWLPNTERLWKELLLLRELRADRYAAEQVDSLLLAEALLIVAKTPLESSMLLTANFSHPLFNDRLTERIEFLLSEPESISTNHWHNYKWLLLSFLPLLTIPLHY